MDSEDENINTGTSESVVIGLTRTLSIISTDLNITESVVNKRLRILVKAAYSSNEKMYSQELLLAFIDCMNSLLEKSITSIILLRLLDSLSHISTQCTALIKVGIVDVFRKLLVSLSRLAYLKQKSILRCLCRYYKFKSSRRRLLFSGFMFSLLKFIQTQSKAYHIQNTIKLHSYVLLIFRSCTYTKKGRRCLNDAKVISSLRLYLHTLPCPRTDSSSAALSPLDALFSRAADIIQRCTPPRYLPIAILERFSQRSLRYSDVVLPVSSVDQSLTSDDSCQIRHPDSSSSDLVEDFGRHFPVWFTHAPAAGFTQDYFQEPQSLINFGSSLSLLQCYDMDDSWLIHYINLYRSIYHGQRNSHGVEMFSALCWPDLLGISGAPCHSEKLSNFCYRSSVYRDKLCSVCDSCISGTLVSAYTSDRLVYAYQPNRCNTTPNFVEGDIQDLDGVRQLISSHLFRYSQSSNIPRGDTLIFDASFESANLCCAFKTNTYVYDLFINPDVNSIHHVQWFYFSIANMRPNIEYTFNIINFEKQRNLFSNGMAPVIFSLRDFLHNSRNSRWRRVQSCIYYHQSGYRSSSIYKKKGSILWTASFSLKFQYENDLCFLAFNYPYTYTRLQTVLRLLTDNHLSNSRIFFKVSQLCVDEGGNSVPLCVITSGSNCENKERDVVFLSSRVHPGESPASWVVEGCLRFLLDAEASHLRDRFVFVILPMINVSGVIHGCHRYNLLGEDLNRMWYSPTRTSHPVLFNFKKLIGYVKFQLKRNVFLFCDIHAHSCRHGVFIYGCEPKQSSAISASQQQASRAYSLAKHMSANCAAFDEECCHWRVQPSRQSTARVVIWQQFSVARSYTLECSFSGTTVGAHKGYHFSAKDFLLIGRDLCASIGDCARDVASFSACLNTPETRLLPSFRDIAGDSVKECTDAPSLMDSDTSSEQTDISQQ